MDNLYTYMLKGIFTNVEIIIQSDTYNGSIYCHKVILSAFCPYFETMFINNFSEKDKKEIVMSVPDGYVLWDVINSLYGQQTNMGSLPAEEHQLKTIICRDYLGLPNDIAVIDKVKP